MFAVDLVRGALTLTLIRSRLNHIGLTAAIGTLNI